MKKALSLAIAAVLAFSLIFAVPAVTVPVAARLEMVESPKTIIATANPRIPFFIIILYLSFTIFQNAFVRSHPPAFRR